jgi:hypothetical protein
MTQQALTSGAARDMGSRAPLGWLREERNWFERLCGHFNRSKALRTAKQARAQAYIAYAEAKKRGDTRSVHYAAKALRVATTAVVRIEVAK